MCYIRVVCRAGPAGFTYARQRLQGVQYKVTRVVVIESCKPLGG